LEQTFKINGRYFSAGVSKSVIATLEKSPLGLNVREDDQVIASNLEVEEITDRLANVPRKVMFADGSTFECTDDDDLDKLLGQSGNFFSRLSKVEGSLRLVLLATVLCFASIWGIYRYGLPAAAYVAAKGIS